MCCFVLLEMLPLHPDPTSPTEQSMRPEIISISVFGALYSASEGGSYELHCGYWPGYRAVEAVRISSIEL